jgi:DNA-binding NarL/FixJ family response regulator
VGQHARFDAEESEKIQCEVFWGVIAEEYGLSFREVQVAELLFLGLSRPEIAKVLECAAGTVRVYIDRLYQKMEVKDRLSFAIRLTQLRGSK